MAEGKSKVKTSYEVIYEMGDGLVIAKVNIMDIREQDINAQVMKPEMMKQLVQNIKKRGQLESLPLCVLTDKIEMISGHHRYRAARQAGLKEMIVILDVSGLSRSQIVAKQLAHNAINGFSDPDTLKELAKMITEVDDMIESFIGKDILEEPMAELDKLLSPAIDFDWRNLVFLFLPHQVADLEKLVETVDRMKPDYVAAANVEQYKGVMETLSKFQGYSNIKNVGAAIHAMIKITEQHLEDVDYDPDKEWVLLTDIFGGASIPKESADMIKEAVKKMQDDGEIDGKAKWKFIEKMAMLYVGGK